MLDLITSPTADEKAASAAIRTHCRWHIAPVITETVTVEADASPWLLLPTLALRTVDTVTRVDVSGWSPTSTFRQASHGVLTRTDGQLWHGVYEVTFTHGLDECPPEVIKVIETLVHAGTFAIDKYETAALAAFKIVAFR